MSTIRVTGVQMNSALKVKENLPVILEHIKKADADFILFPEMSLTGYHGGFNEEKAREGFKQIAAACRQHYVTAIIGTGIKIDGHSHIQSRIYTDGGTLLGTHEKIVPTNGDREWCRPGEELRVFQHKGITFGCLICNDLWVTPGCGPYPDPRLSYQLGKKGAQAIFHAVNSGGDQRFLAYHESNLRLRAMESKTYIVTANAAVPGGPTNCPSGVVSPDGEWLVQCSREGEHTFTCDLDLETED